MKKIFAILLSTLLVFTCFVACGDAKDDTPASTEATSEVAGEATSEVKDETSEDSAVSTEETTAETTEGTTEETTAETTEEVSEETSEAPVVSEPTSLIGSWEANIEGVNFIFTFNEDGTGSLCMSMLGQSEFFDATYTTDGNKLIVDAGEALEFEGTYEIKDGKLTMDMDGEALELTPCETPERPAETSDEESEESVEGEYVTYNNGYISFEYSADYKETSVSGAVALKDTNSNDNIVVGSEPYTEAYKNMTAEQYVELVGDALATAGMEISEVEVSTYENPNGVEMTVIDYFAEVNGVEMVQYLFVMKAGNTNQVVTLTQTGEYPEMFDHLVDSIKVVAE